MVKLIVATDPKGLIGFKNRLPWSDKKELAHFVKTTRFSTLLVGYNTYLSLPKKLPNRTIVVLTSHKLPADVKVVSRTELPAFLRRFRQKNHKDLFIAGGKKLYESLYQHAEVIYHSVMHKCFEGDTYINLNYGNYLLHKKTVFPTFTLNVYHRKKVNLQAKNT